jgi:hypothetical protein
MNRSTTKSRTTSRARVIRWLSCCNSIEVPSHLLGEFELMMKAVHNKLDADVVERLIVETIHNTPELDWHESLVAQLYATRLVGLIPTVSRKAADRS